MVSRADRLINILSGSSTAPRSSTRIPQEQTLWADYGKDFYASTSFSDIPATDGRRIWLGWLLNWEYAGKVPTFPWRGVQSIPRALSLKRFPEGIRLVQSPVREFETLRQNHASLGALDIASANRTLLTNQVRGDALEIVVELDGGNSAVAGIRVRKGKDETTTIGVDWVKQEVFVDRRRSGNTSFDGKFAGRHAGPLLPAGGKRVKLHIFVDRSSVEVFVNDGATVISDAIFPSRESQGIELLFHWWTSALREAGGLDLALSLAVMRQLRRAFSKCSIRRVAFGVRELALAFTVPPTAPKRSIGRISWRIGLQSQKRRQAAALQKVERGERQKPKWLFPRDFFTLSSLLSPAASGTLESWQFD